MGAILTKKIDLRLTEEERAAIEAEAEAAGVTRSEWIRALISLAIDTDAPRIVYVYPEMGGDQKL